MIVVVTLLVVCLVPWGANRGVYGGTALCF